MTVSRAVLNGVITIVERDDVQAVQQLPLVLMDPLHLNIKHGVGVDFHLIMLFKMHSEFHLILLQL